METFSPARLLEAMNGMSNIDLAERLGCARSNITMYLNGTRTPSKMTIQLMALNLNVSPAWLMGLNVDKYVEKPPAVSDEGLNEVTDIFKKLSSDNRAKLLELSRLYLDAQSKTEES